MSTIPVEGPGYNSIDLKLPATAQNVDKLLKQDDKITDYFLRLKTQSINNEKYTQTLSIILELLRNENKTNSESEKQVRNIFKRVTEPSNYKFLINSLASKN